jgi:hypothetical protein
MPGILEKETSKRIKREREEMNQKSTIASSAFQVVIWSQPLLLQSMLEPRLQHTVARNLGEISLRKVPPLGCDGVLFQ